MSRYALGTVQFGIDYGLTNTKGKVAKDEVFKILSTALDHGITTLDTASGYGDAEKILGEFKDISKFQIITKGFNSEATDQKTVFFLDSLKKLNVDHIYGYLLHRYSDLYRKNSLLPLLNRLKSGQYLKKVGVSLYEPRELEELLLKNMGIDIIQVPLNIFDQRFLKNDLLKRAKDHGLEIHIRSIYLQGLLFSNKENLHPFFFKHIETFNNYYSFLSQNEISPANATACFLKKIEEIDKIIVGVCSVDQLLDLINAKDINLDFDFESLSTKEPEVIDPLTWIKNKVI